MVAATRPRVSLRLERPERRTLRSGRLMQTWCAVTGGSCPILSRLVRSCRNEDCAATARSAATGSSVGASQQSRDTVSGIQQTTRPRSAILDVSDRLRAERRPSGAGRTSWRSETEPIMGRVLIAAMLAALFGCNAAFAQITGTDSILPLEATSPLGMGPGSPVAPTGIPLGATEMASPGMSPLTSGASPMAPSGVPTGCFATAAPSAIGMSSTGISSFDGGGIAGTASGTCTAIATGGASSRPAASASSPTGMASSGPVGRVGIPLGSTELGPGGLSPPPEALTVNPSTPVSTAPCQIGATSSTQIGAMSSTSGLPSTVAGSPAIGVPLSLGPC